MNQFNGLIRYNTIGHYLSWEINLEIEIPNLWGGSMSLLYNIFHAPFEILTSKEILKCGNGYLRVFATNYESQKLQKYLNKTNKSWCELFDFFEAKELNIQITLQKGILFLVLMNVTEHDQKYMKTLSTDERDKVRFLLENLYLAGK